MTTRPGYVWDATASEWVEIGQAAVVAPVAYQASEPVSPATGDIWIDSDEDVPSVDSTLYYRWTKTMSGGETSLSGTDDNSLSLQYTPGYESVFINGVLQVRNLDYTATSGSTISGLTALASNDIVMVESIVAYSVGDTYTQTQISSLLDAKSPVSTTGLVLITSQTIGTAVSSVVVNNAFSADYDAYKIIVSGGVSSLTTTINMRLAGITTGYYGLLTYQSWGSSTVAGISTSNVAQWAWVGAATTVGSSVNCDVINPFLTTRKVFSSSFVETDSGGLGAFARGYVSSLASATGFSLFPSSGTLTGGTIRVYGYKN